MPDKEKVIYRLKREVARTDLEWLDCVEVKLLQDTLALLKAQEPRVMTLEEVSKWHNAPESERDPIYVEYLPNSGLGISRWTTEYFGFNPNSYPNKDSGYYGKWLRCWTSRPDEKRRAETPWGTQSQREYEAAVEMAEYCERYEPTYNAEDGSM